MILDDLQLYSFVLVGLGFLAFVFINNRWVGGVLLFLCLFSTRALYLPIHFPDFTGYFYYYQALTANGAAYYGYFEILSKMLFVYSGNLISWVDGLTAVHWVVFCLSFTLFLTAVNSRKLEKISFVLMLAVIGPIVLLVTMRASIAYALITLFIVRGARFGTKDSALLLISPAFHISVLLLVVPLLMYFIIGQWRITSKVLFRFTLLVIVSGGLLKLVALVLPVYSGLLNLAAAALPNLAKYDVYLVGQINVFHDLYFILMAGLILFCYFNRKFYSIDIRLLLILSWVFFLVAPLPVVAFRYSLFFVIPLILTTSMPRRLASNVPFLAGVCMVSTIIYAVHLLALHGEYF